MTFNHKPPIRNTKRVIRRFTFLPYRFDDTTYWLQFINIQQQYKVVPSDHGFKRYWEDIDVFTFN
jgi:hypothetical protein